VYEFDPIAFANSVLAEIFTINEPPVHFHDHCRIVFLGPVQEVSYGQLGTLEIFYETVE
jgi:hypothetical protein